MHLTDGDAPHSCTHLKLLLLEELLLLGGSVRLFLLDLFILLRGQAVRYIARRDCGSRGTSDRACGRDSNCIDAERDERTSAGCGVTDAVLRVAQTMNVNRGDFTTLMNLERRFILHRSLANKPLAPS